MLCNASFVPVFRAKRSEFNWVSERTGGGDGGGGGGPDGYDDGDDDGDDDDDKDKCVIRLRGLPYESSKDDITKFFAGEDKQIKNNPSITDSVTIVSCSSTTGQGISRAPGLGNPN